MIRPGSKGRAAERAAISVLRGGHPYRRGGKKSECPDSARVIRVATRSGTAAATAGRKPQAARNRDWHRRSSPAPCRHRARVTAPRPHPGWCCRPDGMPRPDQTQDWPRRRFDLQRLRLLHHRLPQRFLQSRREERFGRRSFIHKHTGCSNRACACQSGTRAGENRHGGLILTSSSLLRRRETPPAPNSAAALDQCAGRSGMGGSQAGGTARGTACQHNQGR